MKSEHELMPTTSEIWGNSAKKIRLELVRGVSPIQENTSFDIKSNTS